MNFGVAPRIFSEGHDCLIDSRFQDANKNCGLTFQKGATYQADRGAVTDQQGYVLSSSHTARLGRYYTIWLTGLGENYAGKMAPVNLRVANVPVYGYTDDTSFDYGNLEYVGESPQFPGLYQINFKMPTAIATGSEGNFGYPPMFPCGEYRLEISLDLAAGGYGIDLWDGMTGGWALANLIQVPIVVHKGDVPCTQ
jgi:hypothetical protein